MERLCHVRVESLIIPHMLLELCVSLYMDIGCGARSCPFGNMDLADCLEGLGITLDATFDSEWHLLSLWLESLRLKDRTSTNKAAKGGFFAIWGSFPLNTIKVTLLCGGTDISKLRSQPPPGTTKPITKGLQLGLAFSTTAGLFGQPGQSCKAAWLRFTCRLLPMESE